MHNMPELFAPSGVPAGLEALLDAAEPWQILTLLDSFLARIADDRAGHVHPTAVLEGGPIYIHASASVGPHAHLLAPVWLGPRSRVKHAAHLRGGAVLAEGAEVGHSSEVKRSLLLKEAKAPHFNYVGDSIIGQGANLGAGVKLANVHTFGETIKVAGVDSGMRKLGAVIGDHVSIGCNAVLAPGTVVGARSVIYHGAMVRGIVPADSVVKHRAQLEQVRRH